MLDGGFCSGGDAFRPGGAGDGGAGAGLFRLFGVRCAKVQDGRGGTALLYADMVFPLFAGWALLPGAALRAKIAPGLALCATAALAAPKAARIDFAAMDPFATPFYQCFAENARRLNWRAGVGSLNFSSVFTQVPGAEMEQMLTVGTFRQPGAGRSFMVVDVVWNLNVSGEYQFVVANAHNGRVFDGPPLAGGERLRGGRPGGVLASAGGQLYAGQRLRRAAFGEPQEEINCAGVGLLHYDPPLKFDFSAREHPYLAPVARW